ncbi:nuclear transport factor 2 family protein [Flavobacterium sp.]|jgi:hypothetical protein|uniref:nuclear transport factor 2 family protein n=1 Tax=Flavobacterium sp. TaxID=239 RepID=UPI0037C0A949
MKNLLIIILFLIYFPLNAQDLDPKKVIEDFFIAFHAKDTITLKEWCHPEIIMQTIANSKEGNKIDTNEFSAFLKSIASIPLNMKFEERVLNYNVQIDGNLAHVWTPYEFYINDQLSHIGANSFTLYNDNGKWQIIHLIDTRRKK